MGSRSSCLILRLWGSLCSAGSNPASGNGARMRPAPIDISSGSVLEVSSVLGSSSGGVLTASLVAAEEAVTSGSNLTIGGKSFSGCSGISFLSSPSGGVGSESMTLSLTPLGRTAGGVVDANGTATSSIDSGGGVNLGSDDSGIVSPSTNLAS